MFFTEKNRKKNLIISFLALFLFSGVIFAFSDVHSVSAGTGWFGIDTGSRVRCDITDTKCMSGNIVATATEPLKAVFQWLLYGIFVVFGWMTSLAITLFEWVIKPENISGKTGVLNQPVVYEMWKFIRDFFNLFFILVLLYVAFKIVFQIEHDFKKTLLSIVLAALFINFSFPVTRVLIDVTNVPMYFFANQMAAKEGGGTTVFSQVMTASKLQNILLPDKSDSAISRLLVAIIFLFLFAVTLLVLAVMFIVRLVALVILVIFSPVGFAASIVPGLEQYSKMWWENFWKYAFFGPAAMLMVLVSIRFFSALGDQNSGIFKSLTNVASETVANDPTFFASMALFSVPIIMLWMAMGLAQTFSIAGASSVVGMGKKVSAWAGKAPFRAGWAGAKWAGRKYEKKVVGMGNAGKYFSPTAIKDAWKGWREEAVKSDKAPVERAGGAIQDRLNKVFGEHTDHAFAVARKQSSEEEKHITSVSNDEDYISHETLNAVNVKKFDAAAGGLNSLAKGNGLNTFLLQAAQQEKYKNMKDKDGNDMLKKGADGSVEVSSENMRVLLKQVLLDAGAKDDEMLVKQMMSISETATASGNYAFGGMAKFVKDKHGHGKFRLTEKYKKGDINPDTGKPYEKDGDEQADWAASKVRNLESQDRQKKIHPDSLFTRTASGGFGDINGQVALEIISTFTQGDVEEAKRSRDDMKLAIDNAYTHMNEKGYEGFKAAFEDKDNPIFREYVKKIRTLKSAKSSTKEGEKSSEPKKTEVENSRKLPAPTTPPPDWTTTPPGGV